jgi:hypothetical protein
MDRVFDDEDLPPTEKLVLLVMADHADDAGQELLSIDSEDRTEIEHVAARCAESASERQSLN